MQNILYQIKWNINKNSTFDFFSFSSKILKFVFVPLIPNVNLFNIYFWDNKTTQK